MQAAEFWSIQNLQAKKGFSSHRGYDYCFFTPLIFQLSFFWGSENNKYPLLARPTPDTGGAWEVLFVY